MTKRKLKLLVFGIDSADWTVVGDLIARGELPALGRLARDGALLPLRSIIPPITACAWPTLMTGANPGKHGMFNFIAPTADARLLTNSDRLVPAIWELADRAGLEVGCFNIPFTYPPDRLSRGFIVCGEMGSPSFDRPIFHPPELYDEARRVVGRYSLEPPLGRGPGADERWQQFVEAREKLCLYLLRHHTPDVFIAVVNHVDYIQHAYMADRRVGDIPDIVLWAYKRADALLAQLLEAAGDDTAVLVISDHGAGPVEGFLDVPGLLHKLGFLHYRKTAARRGVRQVLMPLAQRLYRALTAAAPRRLRRMLQRFAHQVNVEGLIDWQRTTAYYAGPYSIVINTEGRSDHPTVAPSDRLAVARDLADAINDVVSPLTGKKDIRAYLREELYDGPALDRCPDVIIAPADFTVRVVKGIPGAEKIFWSPDEVTGREFITRWMQGDHRMDGILAMYPAPPSPPQRAQLADVAPTALALLGLPIPDYVDGRPLVPADASRQPAQPAPQRPRASSEVYSSDEQAAVERRLRDLGYL